ncbi:hypothetical protein, partial [Nitratifractor sp.]
QASQTLGASRSLSPELSVFVDAYYRQKLHPCQEVSEENCKKNGENFKDRVVLYIKYGDRNSDKRGLLLYSLHLLPPSADLFTLSLPVYPGLNFTRQYPAIFTH